MEFSSSVVFPTLLGGGVITSVAVAGFVAASKHPNYVSWLVSVDSVPDEKDRAQHELFITNNDEETKDEKPYIKKYFCQMGSGYYKQIDKSCEIFGITPAAGNKTSDFDEFQKIMTHAVKSDFTGISKYFYRLKANITELSNMKIHNNAKVSLVSTEPGNKVFATFKVEARGKTKEFDAFVPYLLVQAKSETTKNGSSEKKISCRLTSETDANFVDCQLWKLASKPTNNEYKKIDASLLTEVNKEANKETKIEKDEWYMLKLKHSYHTSHIKDKKQLKLQIDNETPILLDYKAGFSGSLINNHKKYLYWVI